MKFHCRLIVVAISTLMIMQASAWAHAFIDHAEPRVGSEVDHSPGQIKVWFTDDLNPATSGLQVLDADGKQVDLKDCHADADDKSLFIVSLPHLPPGTYKVVWHAVSMDTHRTDGDFKFVVKP